MELQLTPGVHAPGACVGQGRLLSDVHRPGGGLCLHRVHTGMVRGHKRQAPAQFWDQHSVMHTAGFGTFIAYHSSR